MDLAAAPAGPSRQPFGEETLAVLQAFRPPVVSFPAPELLAPLRAWGARILASASTVDEARWLEAHGAVVIIAQGLEAGGLRGIFLGVAAARALGAAGMQVGTAYLLCPEADTSALHRAALQNEAAGQTMVTNVSTGRPARSIVNRVLRELGPLSPLAPAFPLAGNTMALLRTAAEARGSSDFTVRRGSGPALSKSSRRSVPRPGV